MKINKLYQEFVTKVILIIIGIFALFLILGPDDNCDEFEDFRKLNIKNIYSSKAKLVREIRGRVHETYALFYRKGVLVKEVVNTPCSWNYFLRFGRKNCEILVEENSTFVLYSDKFRLVLPIFTKKEYRKFEKYFPDSAKLIDTNILCDE